jgi:hypothetical protein
MKIKEIIELIEPYIEMPVIEFAVVKQMFAETNGRKKFNKTIRDKVENKFGVYVWVNKKTSEIVYIGMAGKIKTDGSLSKHSIQKRLLASRGKDKITKKDVQTNDYVCDFMVRNNIETLDFYIIYSKKGEPPAYIESLLLYNYYKKTDQLPILNNSF